jgi:hypothetical protein
VGIEGVEGVIGWVEIGVDVDVEVEVEVNDKVVCRTAGVMFGPPRPS